MNESEMLKERDIVCQELESGKISLNEAKYRMMNMLNRAFLDKSKKIEHLNNDNELPKGILQN